MYNKPTFKQNGYKMRNVYLKIPTETPFDDLPYRLNDDTPIFNEIARETTCDDLFYLYPIHSHTTINQLIDIFNSPNFPTNARIVFI